MGVLKIVENGFEVSKDSSATADVSSGETVVPVGSHVGNFAASNRVRVTLSTGATQDTTVASVDSGAQTITLGAALTADVSSGALIRVRLMDTLDAMETASVPVAVSDADPLVGEFVALYRGTDTDSFHAPQVSLDGVHYMSLLGTTVLTTAAPVNSGYGAASHIRFFTYQQSSDDFDLFVGFN